MQHDTTEPEGNEALTPQQERALAALLSGSTVTRAAELVGVDRTTVHRWLRDDWTFQAALNRARREFRDGLRANLESVGEQAVRTVRQAIEADDVRVALAVLKGLGLLGGEMPSVGEDDPGILREEAQLRRNEAEMQRRLRALNSLG